MTSEKIYDFYHYPVIWYSVSNKSEWHHCRLHNQKPNHPYLNFVTILVTGPKKELNHMNEVSINQ